MYRRSLVVASMLSIVVSLGFAGCAHVQPRQGGVVIKSSHQSEPEWVHRKQFFQRDARLFFSGGVENAADYSLARSQARAQAMKAIIDGIQTRSKRQYSEALQGRGLDPSDLGRYVQDAVAWTSEAIDLQGLMPEDEFYEKVEFQDNERVYYRYNLFGLYAIPESQYKAAQQRALDRMLGAARAEQDRKAEQAAQALLDDLKGE